MTQLTAVIRNTFPVFLKNVLPIFQKIVYWLKFGQLLILPGALSPYPNVNLSILTAITQSWRAAVRLGGTEPTLQSLSAASLFIKRNRPTTRSSLHTCLFISTAVLNKLCTKWISFREKLVSFLSCLVFELYKISTWNLYLLLLELFATELYIQGVPGGICHTFFKP